MPWMLLHSYHVASSLRARCHHRDSALACVSQLETVHFQLFTSFVVHTDVMCQHIAHSIFQDRSELAARQLLGAAAQASSGLQNITAGLHGIIRDQESVVKAQSVVVDSVTSTAKVLRDHHARLKSSIAKLAGATDSAFSRVDSKLAQIDGTLDTVLYLERAMNSYADTVNQAGFYTAALFVLWIVTSDVRVTSARPGAIVAGAVFLIAERLCWSMATLAVRSNTPGPDSLVKLAGVEVRVLDAVFGIRLTYALFLTLWVMWSGCSYRDHAKVALAKLEALERWIAALLRSAMLPSDGAVPEADCGTDEDAEPDQAEKTSQDEQSAHEEMADPEVIADDSAGERIAPRRASSTPRKRRKRDSTA